MQRRERDRSVAELHGKCQAMRLPLKQMEQQKINADGGGGRASHDDEIALASSRHNFASPALLGVIYLFCCTMAGVPR
jgi:hypothetical protein